MHIQAPFTESRCTMIAIGEKETEWGTSGQQKRFDVSPFFTLTIKLDFYLDLDRTQQANQRLCY